MFSHDELLTTIFHHEKSPKTSRWLLPLFQEMVDRELADRTRARDTIPLLKEVVEDEDRPDEYYQCQKDKSYCYLSQITSPADSFVTCPEHYEALSPGTRVLKVRYTDEELRAMLARVKQRANSKSPEEVEARKVNCAPRIQGRIELTHPVFYSIAQTYEWLTEFRGCRTRSGQATTYRVRPPSFSCAILIWRVR